jgi:hypothetical protein
MSGVLFNGGMAGSDWCVTVAAALARGRGVVLTSVGEGRTVASSSICDSVFAPSGLGERRTAASIGRVLAPSKVMEGRTAASIGRVLAPSKVMEGRTAASSPEVPAGRSNVLEGCTVASS